MIEDVDILFTLLSKKKNNMGSQLSTENAHVFSWH